MRSVAAIALLLGALPVTAQFQQAYTIIMVGPPGSGKTVQAEALRKKYKIPAISMAQLIREEFSRHPSMTGGLSASVESGELLADGPANNLIQGRLARHDVGRGFILDGFPTSEAQAKVLDQWILDNNLPRPAIIILEVPEDVSRERLKRRRRPGDDSANVDRRLREYREIGRLVESWYGNARIVRVDGMGAPAEVTDRIVKGIAELPSSRTFKSREPEEQRQKLPPPK